MIKKIGFFCILIGVTACKTHKKADSITKTSKDVVLAFGSCNQASLKNELWDDVLANSPNMWIWGGDIVYADTENMELLKKEYNKQLQIEGYKELIKQVPVMGTWDDHDYGLNDGGHRFVKKKESQQEFLDFIGVKPFDILRKQEGIYTSKTLVTEKGSVKILILDTRYFRTDLTPSGTPEKRYQPNPYGQGTVLGEHQWQWLERELNSSTANFNIIVSSIQFCQINMALKHGVIFHMK